MIILNPKGDTSELDSLMTDGVIKLMPFDFFKRFPMNDILLFMQKHGLYTIPNIDLIEQMKQMFSKHSTIEIGAGNGGYGLALQIPTTDSHQQARPEMIMLYKTLGQAPIIYPKFVEKLDALSAVEKYKPYQVFGSYITHKYNGINGNADGVNEELMLTKIQRYVMLGNLHVEAHATKPLLSKPHQQIHSPFIIARAQNQNYNRFFVFGKMF